MEKSMALSEGKAHWCEGEPESQLFVEDRFAMAGLPEKPFSAVRWVEARANKRGRIRLDGRHVYSAAPELARDSVLVGLGAHKVTACTVTGEFVCAHDRAYGDASTDSGESASQLAALCLKAGAWQNSQVRAGLPEQLRSHMDGLAKKDLRAELRILRNQSAESGHARAGGKGRWRLSGSCRGKGNDGIRIVR